MENLAAEVAEEALVGLVDEAAAAEEAEEGVGEGEGADGGAGDTFEHDGVAAGEVFADRPVEGRVRDVDHREEHEEEA